MCRPASFVVTKTDILMADTDSHEDIKKKHGLSDGLRLVGVPVEIYPDDLDYARPAEDWKLHTDLPREEWPEWYSEGEAEEACRAKLPEWWATRRILDLSDTKTKSLPDLPACKRLYCSGCTGLTALPDLSACKRLDCHGCTGLTALPDLPACELLYCHGCTGLTALPDLSACKLLDRHGCTGLEKQRRNHVQSNFDDPS